MELLRPYSKLCLHALLILTSIYLAGCLEFESIVQPSSVRPEEMFMVSIEVAVDCNDCGGYTPHLAVRLPDGWTIPGNSFACTGIYNAEIVFDPNLALTVEQSRPSPEGYYWWVGAGNKVEGSLNGTAYATISIQTDEQVGLFFLDYTLGYDNGVVGDRSHGHRLDVVDEYTPRELQVAVEGNAVSLSWSAPSAIEGLLGYHLYRDGQLLNTEPVADTAYSDTDLPGRAFHYSVSSLYEDGDEHVTPYEIKALVFSGGSGEPNAPYQVARAEQLVAIADFPDLLDKHFVLNNNIDLDPDLQGGRVFNKAVIPRFSGSFDGQGHEIQHLTMERTAGPLGLFGLLEFGGRVWNLGMTDVNIPSSSRFVAGLVGQNNGDLNSCYVTGKIMGGNGAGGLVGKNDPNGQIANCYSTGVVSGTVSVGGLVGWNDGGIVSSYSTGGISGDAFVGGLVGKNDGSVSASFWDTQSSGQAASDGGAGLTTDEMMDPFMVGLNGLADDPNWVLDAGRDYPRLAWEGTPGIIVPAADMDWLAGQGTAESPFLIDTADQLILLRKASILWDRHFLLGADIDLKRVLRGGKVFEQAVIPVFSGVFDGADHVISNLRIAGTQKLGLFGTLTSEAEVRNIGVVDAQIDVFTRYGDTGGLVGINDGSIISSYSTGTIIGDGASFGGLAGYNSGSITMSFSTVTVNGWFGVGGLVGENEGSIVSSYSNGSINGTSYLGGLVGRNEGSIVSSYSTGSVAQSDSSDGPLGGLVGRNRGSIVSSYSTGSVAQSDSSYGPLGGLVGDNGGSVEASFWDILTSGQMISPGGEGKSTAEMQTASTFINAGWDFIDETANGTDDIWWILEGQDYPRLWWEVVAGN